MIVPIWGPPQSGKTTLMIDLAHALSACGKSVLLISPEPFSELSARLAVQIRPERSIEAVRGMRTNILSIVQGFTELIFILAAPYNADAFGDNISSADAKEALRQSEEAFDFTLVDCPSDCKDAFSAWSLNLSEKVILLSGSSVASIAWRSAYRRVLDTIAEKKTEVVVETLPLFSYPAFLRQFRIELEISIPHLPNAQESLMTKRTLYRSGGKQGAKYTEALDRLAELLIRREPDEQHIPT